MPNARKKMYIYKNGRYIIPETPELENIIGDIIEADKDILSQIDIEYDADNDETILKFPKNIEPLYFYILATDYEEDCYFDYQNAEVKNWSGAVIGTVSNANNIVTVRLSGEIITDDNTEMTLEYILFQGGIGINAYSLYHPASGGTKLYKHSIRFNCDDGEVIEPVGCWLYLVSTKSIPFTGFETMLDNDLNTLIRGNDISLGGEILSIDEGTIIGFFASTILTYNIATSTIVEFMPENYTITDFSDTVTEL